MLTRGTSSSPRSTSQRSGPCWKKGLTPRWERPPEARASPGSEKNDWLLQGTPPEQVREEEHWTQLLVDSDKLLRHFWMRSDLGVVLRSLAAALPAYTEKDLVVCHRQNSAGAWKCELWTKREFGPRELVSAL